jgi:hypothetical protein
MSAVRIGKIRLKSGGAEIRVLNRAAPNPDGQNWRGELLRDARKIGEMGEPGSDLVGFVIVGVFSDGTSTIGARWDKARCPIPKALLPSWVAEVLRRDMITTCEAERIACDVVNRANGFIEE